MPLTGPARRRLLRRLPPCEAIWITDEVLSKTFNAFIASSKHQTVRHWSNVPGPLEAQRRLSKRRINLGAGSWSETLPTGLPPFAVPGKTLREKWQWEPPTRESSVPETIDWHPTLEWLTENNLGSDESGKVLSEEFLATNKQTLSHGLQNPIDRLVSKASEIEKGVIHSIVEVLGVYMWKPVTPIECQDLLSIARIGISRRSIDSQSAGAILRIMSQVVTKKTSTTALQEKSKSAVQQVRGAERLAGELLTDLWSSVKDNCTVSTKKSFLSHILSLRSERLVASSEFEIFESLRNKDDIFNAHKYLAADLAVQNVCNWTEDGNDGKASPDLVVYLHSLSQPNQASFIISVTSILTYKFITRTRELALDPSSSLLLESWLSTVRAGPWADESLDWVERFIDKFALRGRVDMIQSKFFLDHLKRDVAAIKYHRTRKVRSSFASIEPGAPTSGHSTDPDLILPQNVSSSQLVEFLRYSSVKGMYQFVWENWIQNSSSTRLGILTEEVRSQVLRDLDAPASITSLSSSEYFIRLFEVLEKAKVNLSPIVKFLFPVCRESGHGQLVSDFLVASKDTPWKFPKRFWIDQICWLNQTDARAAVRLFNEHRRLFLLDCGAPFATSLIHNPRIAPNKPIELLEKQTELFEASKKPSKAHSRLVHTMAHAYASASHLYPIVALRQVRRCIWHLARCDGHIHPDMPRALAKAGILRYLEQNRWVGNIRVQEIISHVKLLQGKKAARKILNATNRAKKNLHDRQMAGEVPWTDPRVFPKLKPPKAFVCRYEEE